jgi:hypothetical protein
MAITLTCEKITNDEFQPIYIFSQNGRYLESHLNVEQFLDIKSIHGTEAANKEIEILCESIEKEIGIPLTEEDRNYIQQLVK